MERDRTSRRLQLAGAARALTAAVLAGVALWLSVDNPTIANTSRGNPYTCLAPWDTVLNDADNYPGGEPPPDGDQIAARCRDAGKERFDAAVAVGVLAGVVALSALAVGVVRSRNHRRPTN